MKRSLQDHVDVVDKMSPQCYIQQKTVTYKKENKDSPFTVCDVGSIYEKHMTWQRSLPRVKPFYAVKCNDDPIVLQVMADLGLSFDCASKVEIEKILNLNVHPSRIIYAHPCKQPSFLKYAAEKGVSLMTFDNEAELHKIKQLYPEANLVLRILHPVDKTNDYGLGLKFGCPVSETESLLITARSLDLAVVGVSFHVGYEWDDAQIYALSIKSARDVFDAALKIGHHMTILDIGGAFPGVDLPTVSFLKIADVVNGALDHFFPEGTGVEFIAEPGQYFVRSSFTVCACVIGKRLVSHFKWEDDKYVQAMDPHGSAEEPTMMYYVNDGQFGSFYFLMHDHSMTTGRTVKEYKQKRKYKSIIWGPTCTDLDYITKNALLHEMEPGDWIYFENMGAYSVALSTAFNGMPGPDRFYICDRDSWKEMYPDEV